MGPKKANNPKKNVINEKNLKQKTTKNSTLKTRVTKNKEIVDSDNDSSVSSYVPRINLDESYKFFKPPPSLPKFLEKRCPTSPEDPLISKDPDIKKQAQELIEHFFLSWLIGQDYMACKRTCFRERLIFVDRIEGTDSEGFGSVSSHMYYIFSDYEKRKIIMQNHFLKDNKVYYRMKKGTDEQYDGYVEFWVTPEMTISRFEISKCNKNIPEFDKMEPFNYIYGQPEVVQLKPLPINDPEYEIQEEKGTEYAMIFKLFKAWFITQNVEDMKKLMAPKMYLEDRELCREFYDGKDCAHYFYTFVAHHFTANIYVKQYKIQKGELYIRIHWPEKKKNTDMQVTLRLNKNNQFHEVMMKKTKDPIFTEFGDLKLEDYEKLEKVYMKRNEDEYRTKEDFASAINYNLDINQIENLPNTFSTTDTEYYLEDKILNKEKKKIVKRIDPTFSPKMPLRLMFNISTGSDKDILFTKRYTEKSTSEEEEKKETINEVKKDDTKKDTNDKNNKTKIKTQKINKKKVQSDKSEQEDTKPKKVSTKAKSKVNKI